ncbi:MAG: hypothetical protein ACE368_12165 [Paracoccaceae bacterium]
MSDAPVFEIDPAAFHADPYPTLKRMRAEAPIARVPQLGATLFTRREAIFREEKRVETFSSLQPGGLMTVLMGENMMRKDGAAHAAERKATFPAFSAHGARPLDGAVPGQDGRDPRPAGTAGRLRPGARLRHGRLRRGADRDHRA